MFKPYYVTFNGSVTIYVDANDEEEALEKAEKRLADGDYEFEYDDMSVEVEQEY